MAVSNHLGNILDERIDGWTNGILEVMMVPEYDMFWHCADFDVSFGAV